MSDNKTPKRRLDNLFGGAGAKAKKKSAASADADNGKTRISRPATPQAAQPAQPKAEKPAPPVKGRIKMSTVIGMVFLNMLKALFVVLCVGLIVGSLVAVQVVEYVMEATSADENILDLDNYSVAQTSYFMAYDPNDPNARENGTYIEYQEIVGSANRIWVNYYDIPQNMINAMLATEDREFYEHHGVNIRRTALALINEFIPVPDMTGGASTITQQLVKNITKDDAVEDEESGAFAGYQRKMREIFRAWGLENRYSKETILEAYLNTMSLSGRIAGIEAGAQNYFNKTVSELELHECAMIAGITKWPGAYNPFVHPEACLERRNDVIYFMQQAGFITQKQADEVYAMKTLGLANTREKSTEDEQQVIQSTTGVYSYITDKAYRDVIDDLMAQFGVTREKANEMLQNNGYRIYLTADLNVQAALDDIMVNGYDPETGYFMDTNKFPGYANLAVTEDILNEQGQKIDSVTVLPQVAVAVVNYDGELIATSGGVGEKTESLSLNRSIDSVRQTGSTMKPVAAYALGIDYGLITYSRMIPDQPVRAKNPGGPKDWPRNYSDRYRKSGIPVVSAIAESTNTVAAQVGMYVGVDVMYEFLTESLQISSLVSTEQSDTNDMDLGPLVLGSQTYGISPYEMAGAYMMFGGNDTYGRFTPLHSYSRVEDSRGNVVMEPNTAPIQAIDPQTGYVMNRLLYNVVHAGSYPGGASPTAAGMAVGANSNGEQMESVGKTGTTNDDKDRWFVGLTPYYVTAVWWGYDTPDLDNHNFYRRWSAGARTNIPVNVWKTLMEAVQDEYEVKEFPEMPDGVVQAAYCTRSGNLASSGCPTQMGYYTKFRTPDRCMGHVDDRPKAEAEGEEGEE